MMTTPESDCFVSFSCEERGRAALTPSRQKSKVILRYFQKRVIEWVGRSFGRKEAYKLKKMSDGRRGNRKEKRG
jgi:hypothetical protein